jgi:putative hydrolase of the HAD superfamily
MIGAFVIDLDDTLVQETSARAAAARLLLKRLKSSENEQQFVTRWSAATVKHFTRYVRGEISFIEQRRCRARECIDESLTDAAADELFDGYVRDYEAGWQLYADVEPFMARHSDIPIVVITNGQALQQRAKIRRLGLEAKMRGLVVSEEVGSSKPSPEIFLAACKLARVNPSRCLCIGDSLAVDILGARRVGMDALLLDRERQYSDIADVRVVSSLSQVDAHAL